MRGKWFISTSFLAAIVGPTLGETPSFQGLGDLPGGSIASQALGVSADGSVVVGPSQAATGPQAFRWTEATGMVGLGTMPNGDGTTAYGVSGDGTVIVGHTAPAVGEEEEAFRWTEAEGYVRLGDLPGGSFASRSHAASFDGTVVVGEGHGVWGLEAFVWTIDTGIVGMGEDFHTAHDVSDDGSVVVGQGDSGPINHVAVRWTAAGGMEILGLLQEGTWSKAYGVSADGTTAVGWGDSTPGYQAFRWTEQSGMVGLGDLPSGVYESAAMAASADGSVVVGYGTSELGKEAFIWDGDNGMRRLADVLTDDCGLDLTDWTLIDAWDVSNDGRVIVGYGRNPDGYKEAWRAVIPEPATLALLALGGLALMRRRRHR